VPGAGIEMGDLLFVWVLEYIEGTRRGGIGWVTYSLCRYFSLRG